ncbi:hypothetical protein FRX31_015932 [Thalictrum thalictroides]|uniref:Uncharacterized protein n=1 Tax=Thalictrum thalictroides TaxID=46969 RepID=A0A7J6WD21_THATH|nr:hypothetical protein FRX31_015932 [Thalictrum thalictroides]
MYIQKIYTSMVFSLTWLFLMRLQKIYISMIIRGLIRKTRALTERLGLMLFWQSLIKKGCILDYLGLLPKRVSTCSSQRWCAGCSSSE